MLVERPFGGGEGKYSVTHNLIGTAKDGTTALGNAGSGVRIRGSSGNAVDSNTIAFNGSSGVAVEPTAGTLTNANGNFVADNSVFSNAGLGIDLNGDGRTPNDGDDPSTPGADPDADLGPNGQQNFPVLATARTGGGKTAVKGKLSSAPNATFGLRFYSNPSGGDEGKLFVGSKAVTTDGSGNASFTFTTTQKVAKGRTVIATATGPGNNTSESSAPRTVG